MVAEKRRKVVKAGCSREQSEEKTSSLGLDLPSAEAALKQEESVSDQEQ